MAMDKLLLQTQNLEQALKTERHVVTEEKWVSHTHTLTIHRVVSSWKATSAGLRAGGEGSC